MTDYLDTLPNKAGLVYQAVLDAKAKLREALTAADAAGCPSLRAAILRSYKSLELAFELLGA